MLFSETTMSSWKKIWIVLENIHILDFNIKYVETTLHDRNMLFTGTAEHDASVTGTIALMARV